MIKYKNIRDKSGKTPDCYYVWESLEGWSCPLLFRLLIRRVCWLPWTYLRRSLNCFPKRLRDLFVIFLRFLFVKSQYHMRPLNPYISDFRSRLINLFVLCFNPQDVCRHHIFSDQTLFEGGTFSFWHMNNFFKTLFETALSLPATTENLCLN